MELPPPAELIEEPVTEAEKRISAADQFLVKLGMKTVDECEIVEEGENMMEQIKCAGRAGIISYIFWEWAFWGVSIPVAIYGFYVATGHWPDFKDQDDLGKLGAEAFAFVNVARFAVPLRVGLALSTTPWVDENVVQRFLSKDEDKEGKEAEK